MVKHSTEPSKHGTTVRAKQTPIHVRLAFAISWVWVRLGGAKMVMLVHLVDDNQRQAVQEGRELAPSRKERGMNGVWVRQEYPCHTQNVFPIRHGSVSIKRRKLTFCSKTKHDPREFGHRDVHISTAPRAHAPSNKPAVMVLIALSWSCANAFVGDKYKTVLDRSLSRSCKQQMILQHEPRYKKKRMALTSIMGSR